jgi:hypothetical protein
MQRSSRPGGSGANVLIGSFTPRTCPSNAAANATPSPTLRRVASDTRIGEPAVLVSCWMREAMLTASPMTVYSRRCGEPMLPTTTGPVWMPMPTFSSGLPAAAFSRFSAARASSIATAHLTARAAWSVCGTGAPK